MYIGNKYIIFNLNKTINLQMLNGLCFFYCFRRPLSARALVW